MIGQHLNFMGYGHWLPNDIRGSTSREVRNPALAELGEIHHGRKRVQPPRPELRQFHRDAREVLENDALWFDAKDIALLADCFRETILRHKYTCYGCAITPNHVHLLIRRHRDHGPEMIAKFKAESLEALRLSNPRWANHPVWGAGPGWQTYQGTPADMRRIVKYIREQEEPPQEWDFVQPYTGWVPGNYRPTSQHPRRS